MKTLSGLKSLLAAVGCLALLSCCGGAQGQAVPVNPGYKALVRPIHYSMPLAPKDGPHALIVYGKNAPWTQKAAQALQKAVADWCGVKLELVDDQTVTNEDTWLLNDAYRKTPLIVLGNAQDNRVMHAMGVHFLLQSNRYWPGGDRYFIRSVFEPFVADVNYVSLEASTQAGMDGAVAKLGDLRLQCGPHLFVSGGKPPDESGHCRRIEAIGCVGLAGGELLRVDVALVHLYYEHPRSEALAAGHVLARRDD